MILTFFPAEFKMAADSQIQDGGHNGCEFHSHDVIVTRFERIQTHSTTHVLFFFCSSYFSLSFLYLIISFLRLCSIFGLSKGYIELFSIFFLY